MMRAMAKALAKPVRNFHLPLPEPLYRRLREVAERANRPATAVARYAIESWLRHQRRAGVREAIAAYAAEAAGSHEDLDPDLEAASLEAWRQQRRPRRPPPR
jgi:predicted transcriptional regulator